MRLNIVILLISISAFTGVLGIPFEDCGSMYDLRQVDIDQCTRAPCKMTVGTNSNVTVKFVANVQSQRLNNAVFFYLNNVEVDAKVLDHTCPAVGTCVSTNQEMEYTAEIAVSEDLPTLPGQLDWRIRNENDLQIICFRVAIALVM